MKIEVMVDKDNTHFSYKFVVDAEPINNSDGALIIRNKKGETIAVFAVWSFWRQIPDDDQKKTRICQHCGKNFEAKDDERICDECDQYIPDKESETPIIEKKKRRGF